MRENNVNRDNVCNTNLEIFPMPATLSCEWICVNYPYRHDYKHLFISESSQKQARVRANWWNADSSIHF